MLTRARLSAGVRRHVLKIVSAGVLGHMLSQVTMRLEPLRTVLSIFSASERIWIISPTCALVAMFTLAWSRQLWRKYNWNPYLTILAVGALASLAVIPKPSRWTESPNVHMDFVLGMLELFACITPGAMLAQRLAPNMRLERSRP